MPNRCRRPVVVGQTVGVEWIAHRAGNVAETSVPAIAIADAVELDVHRFRGRLEVRHGKVLWPCARLWERWELLPVDSPRPLLGEILDATPDGAHLWLDLKGPSRRLTRRALTAVGDRRPLTVSCRVWWALRPARRADDIRTMKSVGTRWQRRLVVRTRFGERDGIAIHERLVDAGVLATLHRVTPNVICWGVVDDDRARELASLGVSGLIVDDLTMIGRVGRPAR